MINYQISNSWKKLLADEFEQLYFKKLICFLEEEKKSNQIVYPSEHDVFNAFNTTSFEKIKVVILGQDPYHGKDQAHGLAFSVKENVSFPPSLRNIFREYCSDLGYKAPSSGDLTKWAEEGVFLLNTVLTVRANEANSHKNMGWEIFTDSVIKLINEGREHIVFILWGKPAQQKANLIDQERHLILKSSHPSPLSSYRGFFGSCPFTKTNNYLNECGIEEIDWKLD